MTFKFWLKIAYGIALAVVVTLAAYWWPVLGLCLVTIGFFWVAHRFQENTWLVISCTLCVIFMWGFAFDVMHSNLLIKGAQEIKDLFTGTFQALQTNFFSK